MRRGQRTFPSEYYEDGHTLLLLWLFIARVYWRRERTGAPRWWIEKGCGCDQATDWEWMSDSSFLLCFDAVGWLGDRKDIHRNPVSFVPKTFSSRASGRGKPPCPGSTRKWPNKVELGSYLLNLFILVYVCQSSMHCSSGGAD